MSKYLNSNSRPLLQWRSPCFLLNLTFIVYFLPMLFAMMAKDGSLLENFSAVTLRHPILSLLIFFCNWLVLNLLYKAAPSISLAHWPQLSNGKLYKLLAWMYVFAGSAALVYLNMRLQIPDLLSALVHGDLLNFAIGYATTGVVLATEHLLKFYFLSNMLVIGLFLLRPVAKGILVWNIAIWLLVLDYLLISRREIVIMIALLWLLGRSFRAGQRRKKGLVIGGVIIVIIFVGIINLRTGSSFLDLGSFLGSQEFAPFQVGIFLIDKDLGNFQLGNAMDLFLPLANYPTLAARELNRYFYYREVAGPTVSINYTLFKYGYIPVCVYLYAFFIFCKTSYKAHLNHSAAIVLVLHGFLCMKMFNLIRNGEVFTHLVDLALFGILCLPFFALANPPAHAPSMERKMAWVQ